MNKLSRPSMLLACLSIVLIVGRRACRWLHRRRLPLRRTIRSRTSSGNGRVSPTKRPAKRPMSPVRRTTPSPFGRTGR